MPRLKKKFVKGTRVRVVDSGSEGVVRSAYAAQDGSPVYKVRVPETERPDMAEHRDLDIPEHRLEALA